MAIIEINFKSYNERDEIKGWIYTPITTPKAIVQIVHGFGEHSRRYMHMIYKMLDAGFVVCADDHVAHGKTAADSDTWGDPGNKGYLTTVEDENTLRNIVSEGYPNLPYFMFGHSWGSMIAREYTAKYGEGMSGVVYCGVVSKLPQIIDMMPALETDISSGKGNNSGLEYMAKLFEGMTYRYENPNGPNDWIALEPAVVSDHAADPFNNLLSPPTIHLMNDFARLYESIEADDWAGKIPEDLPIYIIAGDQDPVGKYGEGVYHVANMLWETGHKNVTTKVYSGYRHEIHNEPPIRDEVENGIIEFIEKQL